MKKWLAQQAVRGLLGTALVCSACAATPSSAAFFAAAPTSSPSPPAAPSREQEEVVHRAPPRANADRPPAETEQVAVSPLPLRIGATCALRSLHIDVSDQGGVTLVYTARTGRLEELRSQIHDLVRKHNARSSRFAREALQGFLGNSMTVVAIADDSPRGIRVTLVAPTPDAVPDVFANTELYAPDLVPDPEWQADRRDRCGA